MTHQFVMSLLKDRLVLTPDSEVTSIQYVNRNVINGTSDMEDRWVITLNRMAAKRAVLRGFFLGNAPILVRHYDDVLQEEYRAFVRLERKQKTLNTAIIASVKAANKL